MHEMSLTEGILRIIEDHARSQGFQRVRLIVLEIGALSHAEPEAMRFCLEAAGKSHPLLQDFRLEILRPPGQAWCMDCCCTVSIEARFDPCPLCGGHKLQVTAGDELRVKELEVD